jgi:DNA-binding NarL/FixJ family response regulator
LEGADRKKNNLALARQYCGRGSEFALQIRWLRGHYSRTGHSNMGKEVNRIRVLIADEHQSFRNGLHKSLAAEPSLQVLGEASDAMSAARLTHQLQPDILLTDLPIRRKLEVEASNGLARNLARVRIVVMVPAIEKSEVVEAFRLGTHGIVLKAASRCVLLTAFRSVMAGHYWLENESVAIIVEALRRFLSLDPPATVSRDYGLTPREREIIAKIASGHSNRQVGREFCISERTVKHHLTNIFMKVGVCSRLELAMFAVNHRMMNDGARSFVQEQAQPIESQTSAQAV